VQHLPGQTEDSKKAIYNVVQWRSVTVSSLPGTNGQLLSVRLQETVQVQRVRVNRVCAVCLVLWCIKSIEIDFLSRRCSPSVTAFASAVRRWSWSDATSACQHSGTMIAVTREWDSVGTLCNAAPAIDNNSNYTLFRMNALKFIYISLVRVPPTIFSDFRTFFWFRSIIVFRFLVPFSLFFALALFHAVLLSMVGFFVNVMVMYYCMG